mmetsp:Transcript_6305/g.17073  ORF Transcript_6305/g.17073 Transcript_6305/m.17073 type:complete len:244 (-) Transcript_6305:677-1408(-)
MSFGCIFSRSLPRPRTSGGARAQGASCTTGAPHCSSAQLAPVSQRAGGLCTRQPASRTCSTLRREIWSSPLGAHSSPPLIPTPSSWTHSVGRACAALRDRRWATKTAWESLGSARVWAACPVQQSSRRSLTSAFSPWRADAITRSSSTARGACTLVVPHTHLSAQLASPWSRCGRPNWWRACATGAWWTYRRARTPALPSTRTARSSRGSPHLMAPCSSVASQEARLVHRRVWTSPAARACAP